MNKNLLASNKATVCVNKVCTTVEGEAAKIVNALVVLTVLVAVVAFVIKVTK